MSVVHNDLAGFQQFAKEKLRLGEADSLEELFDLWSIEHPSRDEQTDVHAAIQQGLKDIEAGRYRPADEVTAELRQKYGV